LTDEIFLNQKN